MRTALMQPLPKFSIDTMQALELRMLPLDLSDEAYEQNAEQKTSGQRWPAANHAADGFSLVHTQSPLRFVVEVRIQFAFPTFRELILGSHA